MGWSRNDVALGPASRFPEIQQNFPVDPKPTMPAATWARLMVATGKATLDEILIARGDAVEMAGHCVSMTAEAVQGQLTDANPANDPFVIDTRKPEDYGYNARGMQYGMMGWNKDDTLIAP